jgi:uncharacterized protein (TIGR02246 family)
LYKKISAVIFLLAVSAAMMLPVGASPNQDEALIRELETRQADAWNRHDARDYANLFTKDGDVVNVVGWWWKGRSEIESKLTAAFAIAFRQSTLTITDVDVRFLKPGLAIAHVRWTMVGAMTPPGVPEPRQGIQLQLLQKQRGKWLIESFQNTASIPEVAFPTGPPAAKPGVNQ